MRSAVLALSQCITAGPEIWKRWQMSSINAHMPVRPLALCRSQFNLVPHRVYYACINSIYTCSKKKIKNILRMHKRTNCLQCWPSTHKDLKMDFHPQLDSLNVTITHTGSYYGIVNIDYDWSLYPIIGTLWDCNPSGVFSPVSVCVKVKLFTLALSAIQSYSEFGGTSWVYSFIGLYSHWSLSA